jgi:EAL domain-containing protein (putative c-di-GMP-specific phosphodiesterase class I)
MNVPEFLAGLMKKYDLDESLLKVEITESAYAESSEKIIRTVKLTIYCQNYVLSNFLPDFGHLIRCML